MLNFVVSGERKGKTGRGEEKPAGMSPLLGSRGGKQDGAKLPIKKQSPAADAGLGCSKNRPLRARTGGSGGHFALGVMAPRRPFCPLSAGGKWTPFSAPVGAELAARCRNGVSAETPAISGEADLFLFCFHFRQLFGCSPQNRFCGSPVLFDRFGRRTERLPVALRRTCGAGSRLISFPLPFSPALRLPAPGRPPCPPASWAGNRGTRCRRGGRIWRCSFCSNPAGPACFPPRAARRA